MHNYLIQHLNLSETMVSNEKINQLLPSRSHTAQVYSCRKKTNATWLCLHNNRWCDIKISNQGRNIGIITDFGWNSKYNFKVKSINRVYTVCRHDRVITVKIWFELTWFRIDLSVCLFSLLFISYEMNNWGLKIIKFTMDVFLKLLEYTNAFETE